MGKKVNPMKYFSGSAVTRLPLHKLLAGSLAVVMAASLGVGAMAAGVAGVLPGPSPTPTAAAPSPSPSASATPTPSASPTPAPVQVEMEVTAVQQDIGVLLYTVPAPASAAPAGSAAPADGASASARPTVAPTATPTATPGASPDADGAAALEHVPLTGVEATVVITDAEGNARELPLDTETATVLAEDVEPGEYTVTVAPFTAPGYILPAPQTVTVEEKVEYKADIEGVKEKVKKSSEVNEKAEDSGYGNGGSAPIVDEVTDTVAYAESKKTEVSREKVYTAKLSGDYLVLKDGTVTPYKPVYTNGKLTGAERQKTREAAPIGFEAPGALSLLNMMALSSPAESGPAETATPTPEPTAEPTVAPTATPDPTTEPTATPTATPEPTAEPTATPTATPEPSATPADRFADWPESIAAADLQSKGFDVQVEEKIVYAYTGWQTLDGRQYYYDPATHQPVTGTQVIQGTIYEFGSDGILNQTTRGIDVSKYQNHIDWNAVRADGIDFAIIRVGYRGYGSAGTLVEDDAFRRNIQGAVAAGLRVGVYFYSQATTEAEAVEEASMVLGLVKGYGLPMGVWYDTEKVANATGRADGISAAQRTACAVAFCETIRNGGYTPGVYSYASWFYNQLNFANISKYRTWIAQYKNTLDFRYKYDIWQYTGSGHVNGVPTAVDMNIG